MAIDPEILKQYIDSDAKYAALLADGNHAALADMLNEKDAVQIDRAQIPPEDILAAIDPAEFASLSLEQLMAANIVLSPVRGGVDGKALDLLTTAFPKDGATATALAGIRKQSASVVEALFGINAAVTSIELGTIYKKPDQVQDEKMIVEDGMIFVESADGKTRYALDEKGDVLRDQPIAVQAVEVKP